MPVQKRTIAEILRGQIHNPAYQSMVGGLARELARNQKMTQSEALRLATELVKNRIYSYQQYIEAIALDKKIKK